LACVEAELSKLTIDKESHMLSEMERITAEQTASHCDQLSQTIQQDIAQLTAYADHCHTDSITQMKSACDRLLHDVAGSIDTMSVTLQSRTVNFCFNFLPSLSPSDILL